MIPIILIFLSFSIYWNEFIKIVNVFVLPFVLLFFSSLWRTQNKGDAHYSFTLMRDTFFRNITFEQTFDFLKRYINKWWNVSVVMKKIWIWLWVLVILNMFIISLLSSADTKFWGVISSLLDWLNGIILVKIIVAVWIFIYVTRLKLSWKKVQVNQYTSTKISRDTLISAIVIWGTLCTYILFLMLQLQDITAWTLPEWVKYASQFAKTGFWQLFFVSIINIIFFFVYFWKTHSSVQALLFGFILTSVALLFSAAQKMILYVSEYGFSYEKFYALYAVLFLGILFLIMIWLLFQKKYTDILKITIFLSLWMYAFITIFPTDSLIFKHNLAISESNEKFDWKYQNHMLSTDITKEVLLLKRTNEGTFTKQSWNEWLENREEENKDIKWYEKSLSN